MEERKEKAYSINKPKKKKNSSFVQPHARSPQMKFTSTLKTERNAFIINYPRVWFCTVSSAELEVLVLMIETILQGVRVQVQKFKDNIIHVICTHISQEALPTWETPFWVSIEERDFVQCDWNYETNIYYSNCTNISIIYLPSNGPCKNHKRMVLMRKRH